MGILERSLRCRKCGKPYTIHPETHSGFDDLCYCVKCLRDKLVKDIARLDGKVIHWQRMPEKDSDDQRHLKSMECQLATLKKRLKELGILGRMRDVK